MARSSKGEAEAAPDFDLDVLYGGSRLGRAGKAFERATEAGTLRLSDLRGTPVVINFWASWCGPCREEAPTLQQNWLEARKSGVLYLGLDMQDLSGDALEFIDEFALSYPSLRDPGRDVANRYGLTGIPETYFIDASGRVVGHAIGVVDRRTLRLGAAAARSGEVIGIIRGGAQGGRS